VLGAVVEGAWSFAGVAARGGCRGSGETDCELERARSAATNSVVRWSKNNRLTYSNCLR
jgi:hypothetical protein